jgi:diaminohydroxyphosphoribosylaminopyrimidine deaminase / 5-amino-6-(5-phosphoribosylamino)uracil reductase
VTPLRVAELLNHAARIAARGHGGAEPNPMVGCIIVDAKGNVVAEGFHRRCGGPHAEVEALRVAGARARGATAIVTLEPCAHRGRTGPCTEALIEAGIARVFYAVADPNPIAGGGAAKLASAGIMVERVPNQAAEELVLPFIKRVTTGLPWVSAKWAQSLDGAIALASGESKWFSCQRSRRMVHRERGRVDAILTGIGTVLADDPQLTARDVRVARQAMRVVFDPDARTPLDARVCDASAPTTILVATSDASFDEGSLQIDPELRARVARLNERGMRVLPLGPQGSIAEPLRALAHSGVARVLVEAGGGLLGRLADERLLDEAFVFVSPLLIGDARAPRAVRGLAPSLLAAIPRARLLSVRRRGDDALLHLRWSTSGHP